MTSATPPEANVEAQERSRRGSGARFPSFVSGINTQGAAFAWGLQFAFLNAALALLLSTLLHATDAQVGLALVLYSASGFVASLVIPMLADRRSNYLTWMLVCGVLSLGLSAVLAFGSSLTMAIAGLMLLGGPAACGIIAGIAFYLLMTVVHDPIALADAQLLNAWSFATVTGIGMTLFLDILPRPGLASGLFTNTRRIGSIVSGGVFALASTGAGFGGVFLVCAALAAVALAVTLLVGRKARGCGCRDGSRGPRELVRGVGCALLPRLCVRDDALEERGQLRDGRAGRSTAAARARASVGRA